MKPTTLDNDVTIISGGSRGIGAAIVRTLSEHGSAVTIAGGCAESGRRLADELGPRCHYIPHDVTDEQSWQDVIDSTVGRHGKVTALVNNAGIYKPEGDIENTSPENFNSHYRVNQLGVFLGMNAVAGLMKAARHGSIVNISSIASHRAYPNQISYTTTKWAVRGMTKAAAVDLGQFGIRVNSVHPGFIDTSVLDVVPDSQREAVVSATPLGRLGQTDEIAASVAYLVSPSSGFVTGAELVIDGGLSA